MELQQIIIIFIITTSSVSSFANESWHWAWHCNTKDSKCEKISEPNKGLNNKHNYAESSPYVSQTVCRLTCGKYGALWPIPTIQTSLSSEIITFHPSAIKFDLRDANGGKYDYLQEFVGIFKLNLEKECGGNCGVQSDTNIAIHIDVSSDGTDLEPDSDESYNLDITTTRPNVLIQIQASTIFGARHGLETLSQLIASYKHTNKDTKQTEKGLVMVTDVKIKDKPIYKHRGLLLDTARNYLPIKAIKKQLDAMGASKLNVLHWHATDSQSFPVVSQRVPQLATYGAYSSKKVYNLSDIQDVSSYAKQRGVRVLFEIDAPSHAGNGWQWGQEAGLGNLAVCVNKIPWRQNCIQPPCGQLNPANENVYAILKELYLDILMSLPSRKQFHMGGDEVFIPCWNSTDEILLYMAEKGWGRTQTDFLQLWSEFQEKALEMFDAAQGNAESSIILWSSQLTDPECIETYLPKNRYIIQTWVPTTNPLPKQLLDKGYRLIISTKNAWYLDHGFWGTTQYYTWRTAYKNRIPRNEGILGGEACMWAELVDENSIESRIWPRAAAVAERLWSDPELDVSQVETRFYRHRERLVTRGIKAEAVTPRYCYQNEGECL